MATFDPNIIRAVAIEVQDAVFTLNVAVSELSYQTAPWTVHCHNAALPDPYAVKMAIEQYHALTIRTLQLKTWIDTVKTAEPDDTVQITPPCAAVNHGVTITPYGLVIPETGLTILL